MPLLSDVQIVTVAYNSSDVIGAMLASVPDGVSVVIVDNGSTDTDALMALADAYGAKVIRNKENLGFGAACNIGAAEGDRSWLFFVNPDAVLQPGCIEALCQAASTGDVVSAFSPRVLDRTGKAAFRRRSRLMPRVDRWKGPPPAQDSEVPLLNGAAIFVEWSHFQGVRGFDENIFLYHEDDDLSLRLKHAYGPIRHVHDAVVRHAEGHSTERTPKVAAFKATHMAQSAVYTMKKHSRMMPAPRVALQAALQMLSPLTWISARKRAKSLGFLKGAISALTMKHDLPVVTSAEDRSTGQHSFWKGLAFHRNHKPRGWVRKILFDKNRTPKGPFKFLVVDPQGQPRPAFATWMSRIHKKRTPEQLKAWLEERDTILQSGNLLTAKTIQIIASPHTMFIANLLREALSDTRFTVDVKDDFDQDDADLYIVIAAQYFDNLPPRRKRIMFQVEQSTTDRWFTDAYLDSLQESLGILDYSEKNIGYLRDHNLPLQSLFFVPLAPTSAANTQPVKDRSIDVLFYGDTSFERRQKYLDRLKAEFDVHVAFNVFGDDMRALIADSKVVLNIHAYQPALLETTRVFECLSLGANVVSETALDQAAHQHLDSIVQFVPENDIDAMVAAVRDRLEANESISAGDEAFQTTKFMLLRALLGLGILSPDEFVSLTTWYKLPSDKLALSMPEDTVRRTYCLDNLREGYALFPGLRHQTGWIGCGLSYWYMAQKALSQSIDELTVHEDDAEFFDGHDARLAKIMAYLNENADKWDVFSGLISDISPETTILALDSIDDTDAVYVDRLTGLVFGIYRKAALTKMAAWDHSDAKSTTNAIDRYLEQDASIKTVTTIPFLCGHKDTFLSSIWQSHNADATNMIDKSTARLDRMVTAYKATQNETA